MKADFRKWLWILALTLLSAAALVATPALARADEGYTGKGQSGPGGGTMCWNVACNPAGGGCCKVVVRET